MHTTVYKRYLRYSKPEKSMFESYSRAGVIGIYFPNHLSGDGRYFNSILEDVYPELNGYGIDIIMMAGSRCYDEDMYHSFEQYPWACIYSDDPMFETVNNLYDVYNSPSLIFVDKHGKVVDRDGKLHISNLSNMNEPSAVARIIAADINTNGYDSDW